MKALITGHKGFIGTQLNAELERQGWEVSGIDLKDSRDMAAPGELNKFKNTDVIFHLAAHPTAVSPNTIDAMYAAIDYSNKTGAYLVFASSAAVYHPMSGIYAAQKILCENMIRDYLDPADYTILRFFNVFGHDGHGVIDRFIRAYVKGEPLIIHGSGEQRRDYVYVSDVVRAMIVSANGYISGAYNIGQGKNVSVNELLDYFPGAKLQYKKGNVGPEGSRAILSTEFPWHTIESDIENYIKLEIKNYETT